VADVSLPHLTLTIRAGGGLHTAGIALELALYLPDRHTVA